MATSVIKYTGNLRTEATHIKSGKQIITDAPTDNHGRGEAFSPTDLMATSLGSCMLTVMGIAANTYGINIDNTEVEITKIMAEGPRRVAEIHVKIKFPPIAYSDKEKKLLEHTAHTCPVAKSLHPDLKVLTEFIY